MENIDPKKALIIILVLLILSSFGGFLFYQYQVKNLDQGQDQFLKENGEQPAPEEKDQRRIMEEFLQSQEEKYRNLSEEEKQANKEVMEDFLQSQEEKSKNLSEEEKRANQELLEKFLQEQEEKYQASQE